MFNIYKIGLVAALLASTATGVLAETQFALSTSQNPAEPLTIAMEEAATRIEERTNGEIQVTVSRPRSSDRTMT